MQQNQPLMPFKPVKKLDLHSVHAVYDGIFNSASGKKINIRNPNEDQIDINDIACGLSKICRFGGQIKLFYSVAQHSLLVTSMLPASLKPAGLLHDAPEAYLGDVIKPLKVMLPEYNKLENFFEIVIAKKFGLSPGFSKIPEVKAADKKALELEHAAFQRYDPYNLAVALYEGGLMDHPYDEYVWFPSRAYTAFLNAYSDIFQ